MGTVVDCPVAVSIFTQYGDSEYWVFGVMRPSLLERRRRRSHGATRCSQHFSAACNELTDRALPSSLATWDFAESGSIISGCRPLHPDGTPVQIRTFLSISGRFRRNAVLQAQDFRLRTGGTLHAELFPIVRCPLKRT